MALTRVQVEQQLNSFFEAVKSNVGSEVGNKALPLLGTIGTLAEQAGGVDILDPFQALQNAILDAMASADDADLANSIATIITDLAIDGVTASVTPGGDLALSFNKVASAETESFNVSTGGDLPLFNIDAQGSADFTAELHVDVVFGADGTFTLVDGAGPEIAVGVDANFSLENASADLGIAKLTVRDADPNAPEFSADFDINLSFDGTNFAADASLTGEAALDLTFDTNFDAGLLPQISGGLTIGFSHDGEEFGAPEIALENLTLNLKQYLDIVGEALGDIAEVFNHGALGTIVDVATDPMPALNGLAQAFTPLMDRFDKVGSISGGGDGVITIGDLAVYANPALEGPISNFYRATAIISELRKFGAPDSAGLISIGSGSLLGGTRTTNVDPQAILDQLGAQIDGLSELTDLAKDFLTIVDDALPPEAESTGFTFSLFENPETIFDIFFQNSTAVEIIEYDVPALAFDVQAGGFFPVLGPLGFTLRGTLAAGIDIDIGYDTTSLQPGNDFWDGFYFTTKTNDPDLHGPTRPAPYAWEPVGWLGTTISGGAAINFVAGEAGVAAEFGFNTDAYFKEEKFRPASDDFGCAFDIFGRAYVDVHLYVEVGFGPFKVEKNISLAGATLAEFQNFTCPPATVVPTATEQGLASVEGTDIWLNVGNRANLRIVNDNTGTPVHVINPNSPDTEAYVIALARDPDPNGEDINPLDSAPPTIVPGSLDVSAFGLTQRLAIQNEIRADFTAGNDFVVIQSDVLVNSNMSGGAGNDTMIGGGGRDVLYGDDVANLATGADWLAGGNGDDDLHGGRGDDTLDGGKGGDLLDGGDGNDLVDYSKSNRDTGEGIYVTLSDVNYFGSGGDANGDRFISVERVVGTDFNDYIRATNADFNVYLEGGRGGDILIGGNGNDLLMGGEGGDTLTGHGGEDGTSYITSWGWVDVDLQRTSIQRGGDAQGDRLYYVEDIQGSINNDTLRGDGAANVLDGSNGDDEIEGRGGADKLYGGFGNDTVHGGADGDFLDGGGTVNAPGEDLLTYRNHTAGPVTVDLLAGTASGSTGNDTVARAVHVHADGSAPVSSRYSTFENLEGTNLLGAGDALTGDDGNNTIRGLAGNDTINGGFGDDTLVGGDGGDALTGGEGRDWADYRSSPGGVTVDLTAGTGARSHADGDSLSGIENLRGSDYTDRLIGDGGDNEIDPGLSETNARDFVDGMGGTDTLFLDYSRGTSGKGVIGGIGFAKGSDVSTGSTDSGAFYRETRTTADELDAVDFTGIERLHVIGTSKADEVYGGQNGDLIVTGRGNDIVVSGQGSDFVHAGDGNDSVTYRTDANRALVQPLLSTAALPVFFLSGGGGIDTLSLSLSDAVENVVLAGSAPGVEKTDANLRLSNGSAVTEFEVLGSVYTGWGDDRVTQLGQYDNDFRTGDNDDVIISGLGKDQVDGGGGGLRGIFTGSGDGDAINFDLLYGDKGDLLVLDYSSLEGYGVVGTSYAVEAALYAASIGYVYRTDGSYTGDGSSEASLENRVDFKDIERLFVTGTNQNDVLTGTYITFTAFVDSTVRGDDILIGRGGDDVIYGFSGDDELFGEEGNDTLIGADRYDGFSPYRDPVQVDQLTGGLGADAFVLGDLTGSFYTEGDAWLDGLGNRAVITDFNPFGELDWIQLHGDATDYRTEEVNGSTRIYFTGGVPEEGELIAEVENFADFDLTADYVAYLGDGSMGVAATALSRTTTALVAADAPAETQDPPAENPSTGHVQALATLNGFTVTEDNDPDALLAALGADSGSVSITVEGADEAVGTFSGDPFGLGSGIILSTGSVEDLVGPNTEGGSFTSGVSVPLTFIPVGVYNNNNIYRVDLTGLGIDVNSLRLSDSNSRDAGGVAAFSGFDLNGIIVSTTKLEAGDALDGLNNPSLMPRLDVFDYSAAGTFIIKEGTIRSPSDGSLYGQNNGIVDNGFARLGQFDSPSAFAGGYVTLGDGGEIGFNLTQTLDTDGPLYLYVAEGFAGTGEQLTGVISASSGFIAPSGDLSTDLGETGAEDDVTRITVNFTPKAGDTAFSFDAVLFSEELPEYDGSNLTDIFSIKLNGVEIGSLSNGAALTIKNLVYSGSDDLVYNPPGSGPLADQIRADAYTHTLTISGVLDPGVLNTLTIEVRDDRDAFLDSGILIKEGSFKTFVGEVIPATTNTPPEISAPEDDIVVPENTKAVTTVTATDADTGQTLTYELVAGNDASAFEIDSATGVIRFREAPDFENPTDSNGDNVYDVLVKVTDSGSPRESALQDYHIRVEDIAIENAAPEIAAPAGEILVAENTKPVTTVVATDPNAGQTLRYSIVGGTDKDLFEIDQATGELRFKAAPDFENPADVGGDNVYDVVVGVDDNGTPVLSDTQAYSVRVTDAAESSTLVVTFASEEAGYRNSFGWYNTETLEGGILFGDIEAEGRHPTVKPGVSTMSFTVDSADVGKIGYFLIPDGASECDVPSGEIKVVRLANGTWAIAQVNADGSLGPVLDGHGARALFTETSKNAGAVDYASSFAGTNQNAARLGGDTADGPTGLIAWEDIAATKGKNGTYGKPGDADYDDAVFNVVEVKAETFYGGDGNDIRVGTISNDVMSGGRGDDNLDGGAGDDVVKGGAGNDTIKYKVGDGCDTIDGGADSDTLEIVGTSGRDTLEVHLAAGRIVQVDCGEVVGIEQVKVDLLGSNDTLVFRGADPVMVDLTAGSATGFVSIAGIENVTTGSGNDVLKGGAGVNVLAGGSGDDTYWVDSGDSVVEGWNGGTDSVFTTDSNYSLQDNLENLTFVGGGNFTGKGNDASNMLVGGDGQDKLYGRGGNDILTGGAGSDFLSGGSGNDTFVFAFGFGVDTIDDFDANPNGGQDKLDVSALGITAANFWGRVQIIDRGMNTQIRIDGDVINLTDVSGSGNNVITQADFILA